MPPKPKYTKDEIISAALDIAAKKGIEAITAKELSGALGASTSPIFTLFDSVQQIRNEVRLAAMRRFEAYAKSVLQSTPRFKQVGLQMVRFAIEEPQLYKLCFMSPSIVPNDFGSIYNRLGSVAEDCIDFIQKDYGLDAEVSKRVFEHVWVHTFGIGALCATGMCRFTNEQITQMLEQDFAAIMQLVAPGKLRAPEQ